MDRATRLKSLKRIDHKGLLSAIALVTLQEMLAVQQEIKSVRSVAHGDILPVVGRRELRKHHPVAIRDY